MDFRTRIGGGYLGPVLLLVGVLLLLAWMMPIPGLIATKLLVGAVAVALVCVLWLRTRRTNLAVARFVAALTHGDLTQSFRRTGRGSGFEELGTALDGALARLREERMAMTAANRFAAALIDEAPTPLLAIDPRGVVTLANKAARRLFRDGDGRAITDFAVYGRGFAALLTRATAGARESCHVLVDGLSQRATLSVAQVDRAGERWRIIAVQIIQSELDAAEIATQTSLVRVLTHEIMNSMTPIMSLAATAERLVAAVDRGDDEAVSDARIALATLARRAAGIAHFVENYREFSEFPRITLSRFAAKPWLDDLVRSFMALPTGAGVDIDVDVTPDDLTVMGDAHLLGQVVLNLLKNAGEAVATSVRDPRIFVTISKPGGERTRIVVSDNGPGIPDTAVDDIFLPFFTTKPGGSGVGLSYARQIVLLHRAVIGVVDDGDGATLEIVL